MKRSLLSLSLVFLLFGCAYFNTFYNAEEYYKRAERVTRENQTGQVSREETQLYSQAIDKSKKLLQHYPDSKYTDDAQFIIARSYYYRQDYGLAQKYFEELANQFPGSPYIEELPLWIARCLVKRGDLAMARHEAQRLIRSATGESGLAEAYLLLGEIAVQEDSLEVAMTHLERVVSTSRDGLVKAQAQFQLGELLKNDLDYEGALAAFKTVSEFKPSESLKVQAIINQMDMLKKLGRSEEAQRMIESMLVDDKFVDIRGQLEVELGKIYIQQESYPEAESRFTSVLETYAGQDYAAQAAYHLAEYFTFVKHDYAKAAEKYGDVGKQFRKSPLKSLADTRIKQITNYRKLQFDYSNLERQLEGLAPKSQNKKDTRNTGRRSSSRRRGRGRSEVNVIGGGAVDTKTQQDQLNAIQAAADGERVEVSAEDSSRFMKQMCENRYTLAEYMLFEFQASDTTLAIMADLETGCAAFGMAPQALYMQYYIYSDVKADSVEAQRLLARLAEQHPDYYAQIQAAKSGISQKAPLGQTRLEAASKAFDAGDFNTALDTYLGVSADTSLSTNVREQGQFKAAWLYDHFLLNRELAINSYREFLTSYPTSSLGPTVQQRLDLITLPPEPDDPGAGTSTIESADREAEDRN